MKLIIYKKIGKNTFPFQCEGNNLFELVMESQKLSFDNIPACGICASDSITLAARMGKDEKGKETFPYVYVHCLDCKSELTFGRRKDSKDTFYARRKENGELEWREFVKEA